MWLFVALQLVTLPLDKVLVVVVDVVQLIRLDEVVVMVALQLVRLDGTVVFVVVVVVILQLAR